MEPRCLCFCDSQCQSVEVPSRARRHQACARVTRETITVSVSLIQSPAHGLQRSQHGVLKPSELPKLLLSGGRGGRPGANLPGVSSVDLRSCPSLPKSPAAMGRVETPVSALLSRTAPTRCASAQERSRSLRGQIGGW